MTMNRRASKRRAQTRFVTRRLEKYFARNRVAGKLIRQRLSLFFQFEMKRQRGLVPAVESKPEGGWRRSATRSARRVAHDCRLARHGDIGVAHSCRVVAVHANRICAAF